MKWSKDECLCKLGLDQVSKSKHGFKTKVEEGNKLHVHVGPICKIEISMTEIPFLLVWSSTCMRFGHFWSVLGNDSEKKSAGDCFCWEWGINSILSHRGQTRQQLNQQKTLPLRDTLILFSPPWLRLCNGASEHRHITLSLLCQAE